MVSAVAEADQMVITAIHAEPVVRVLLDLDSDLRDLEIATPSLDEVLAELTGYSKEMAA